MNPQPNDDHGDDQPWLFPMSDENARWFSRFSKFVEMGPLRSIYAVYASEITSKPRSNAFITRAPGAWYTQARLFKWRQRAAEYDTWQRRVLFAKGNASDLERVKKLDELADKMYTRLIAALDTVRVDDKFIAQYLAVMDLLARHTGGYAPQRLEHTGKDGKAIEIEETKLNVFWYMPEISPLPSLAADQLAEEQSDPAPGEQP